MGKSRSVLVEFEGVLLLPESLCEEMSLRPGDILSVEGSPPLSFTLERYSAMLAACPSSMSRDTLLGFVLRFLALPLTAVDEARRVYIPPDVYPLPAGSRLTLFLDGEERHWLQIFVGI